MRRTRRLMVTAAAAGVVGIGVTGAIAAPNTESAHIVDSQWEWVDGQSTNTQGLVFNPFGPSQLQFITGQFAGFQRRANGMPAKVGEVFYIRGVVTVVGTSSDAPIMEILVDSALAPDLDFAISAEHPVRCFFRPDIGKPDKEDATSTCSQTPAAGTQGSFFGSRPLEPGQAFEVQVPVVVKAVKNGIGTGDAAKFGVLVRPASAPEGVAEQHLFVAAAPAGGGPEGTGGATTPGAKPGATALRVTRQGRTTRRLLRFRLVKRSRVAGTIQRRTVVNTANAENARRVRWKTVRRVRARTLRAGTRRIALGKLANGRYRVVLNVRRIGGPRTVVRKTFRVSSPR